MIRGYDDRRAARDLEADLMKEIAGLVGIVLETARSNIHYYPEVRGHLERHVTKLANDLIVGEVATDYWQAWLEQFGKGSMMAGEQENPGLRRYMASPLWNELRSKGRRVVVGRRRGDYKSIDGKIRRSGGSYAGIDLEELAARGDIDRSFGPTPPTFFLRVALQANRQRILEGLQAVINRFPYHKYFLEDDR